MPHEGAYGLRVPSALVAGFLHSELGPRRRTAKLAMSGGPAVLLQIRMMANVVDVPPIDQKKVRNSYKFSLERKLLSLFGCNF